MSNLLKPTLKELGFCEAPWSKSVDNIQQVIDICNDSKVKDFLDKEDIEFDWLVIKINNLEHRQLLWNTAHHPKRAIAYKFESKQARTTLESIERQVGRTGILTPVAKVTKVELSGVNISKVTLHNRDFIINKNIYIWDQVVIQRSGEVIPYIVAVLPDYRDGTQIKPDIPTKCPICQKHISQETSSTGNLSFYCENISCPATIKEKIKHFASRDCMNIEWLGDAIIDLLVENHIINSIDDLYKLPDPNIRILVKNLPGMWDKKIDNIIKQLEDSKNAELRRVINALGIRQVGKKTAKMIADYIKQANLS